MRRTRPVALLGAGNAASSLLLRHPAVSGALGPVKSTSLRVASRLVNALRAGHATNTFDEFEHCRLILAVAPRASRERLLDELRTSGALILSSKLLVIAGADAPDSAISAVMRTARVRDVPGFEGRWFAADGDRHAAIELRRLLGRSVRFSILRPGAPAMFDAAQTILQRVLLAAAAAADDCLRAAAFPPADADTLIERAMELTARAWIRGKRKAWPGELNEADVHRECTSLAAADAALGRWFAAVVTESHAYIRPRGRRQLQSHKEST